MSQASNYLENYILDSDISSNASTLHLYTSNPDEDDSGSELSDLNYSSQSVSFGSASSGSMSTSGDVTFPALDSSATISHWAVKDSSSNLLVYGALSGGDIAASGGDVVKFTSGNLTITCA